MTPNPFSADRPLALVGCGRMGRAMLTGWRRAGLAWGSIIAVDPAGAPSAVRHLSQVDGLSETSPALTVLAVKPQQLWAVGADLARVLPPDAACLSVLAGMPLATLQTALGGTDRPLIRAMPNTPAAVGAGITALCANEAGAAWLDRAADLLAVLGSVVRLDDERQMDAVTAVSGSGPAYIFHLVEALSAAAEAEGLSADLAQTLARATVSGAGALLAAEEGSAADLRAAATSPGGTTEAGLAALMADGRLTKLMTGAVHAAAARSRALGQQTTAPKEEGS